MNGRMGVTRKTDLVKGNKATQEKKRGDFTKKRNKSQGQSHNHKINPK